MLAKVCNLLFVINHALPVCRESVCKRPDGPSVCCHRQRLTWTFLDLLRRIKEHVQGRLTAHTQEVCGLKWSPSGTQLASGGNDNMLAIWQAGAQTPLHSLTDHRAAVKVRTIVQHVAV